MFVVCHEPDSKSRSLGCLWENGWWEQYDDGRFVALDFLIKENSPKIDWKLFNVAVYVYEKESCKQIDSKGE